MEEFYKHIWEFITLGAVGVAVYFFKLYIDQMKEQSKSFISQTNNILNYHKKALSDFGGKLEHHETSMGKATKAINGDMLEIKEDVFSLKKEVNDEVENLKNESARVSREFDTLLHKFELATETFDARYGNLGSLKDEVEMLNKQVTKVTNHLIKQSKRNEAKNGL